MEKEKLQKAILKTNRRYLSGLNDDDAVAAMIAIEQKILGWTFAPRYDTYELISEVDRAVEIMKSKPGFEMEPKPLSYYIDKLRERLVEKAGTPYANKIMIQALEIMGCISAPVVPPQLGCSQMQTQLVERASNLETNCYDFIQDYLRKTPGQPFNIPEDDQSTSIIGEDNRDVTVICVWLLDGTEVRMDCRDEWCEEDEDADILTYPLHLWPNEAPWIADLIAEHTGTKLDAVAMMESYEEVGDVTIIDTEE